MRKVTGTGEITDTNPKRDQGSRAHDEAKTAEDTKIKTIYSGRSYSFAGHKTDMTFVQGRSLPALAWSHPRPGSFLIETLSGGLSAGCGLSGIAGVVGPGNG